MANEFGSSAEDGVAFDDSDQFDEDSMSIYSWLSENEIVGGITWRGWKKTAVASQEKSIAPEDDGILSLCELCAKVVARNYPFQAVEEFKPPVPEEMQMKIAYWSFPQCEDDIQLYSCLVHASVEEFQKSEIILKFKYVQDVMQIGFHLSGLVADSSCNKQTLYKVAVTFDRCKIVTTSCTCHSSATWCAHIIALCLFRMRYAKSVSFHAPISESLSKLSRCQLQKFAQYLINDLPPQVLQTSQKLLDEILNKPDSSINSLNGAPDPTAGACHSDTPNWCLNEAALHEHIRKVLCKFCGPTPTAFFDFESAFLTSAAPFTSLEWSNFLRSLMSREPEGLWNLLDIVKDLFKLRDSNSCHVLRIFTEECLNFHQMALWWFSNETEHGEELFYKKAENPTAISYSDSNVSNAHFFKHTGARLLNECVSLWKIAATNPFISETEKSKIRTKLHEWQNAVVEKASKVNHSGFPNNIDSKFSQAVKLFQGFRPALDAVNKDWNAIYKCLGINLTLPEEMQLLKHSNTATDGLSASADCFPRENVDELFDCLNTLHTLGFATKAQKLAILLAKKLLSSDEIQSDECHCSVPWQSFDISVENSKSLMQIFNCDRVSGAVKIALLCKVLKENSDSHHLAFKVALFGLSLPRNAASSKSLEVKLVHSEMMLHSALKLMIITSKELNLIRASAIMLADVEVTKYSMVVPLILAIYIFEVLCNARIQSHLLSRCKPKIADGCLPTFDDEELGFKSAIKTLGRETVASEKYYPMLCESLRRQRCDLALSMLWHYRDDVDRLKDVLSVILDASRYGCRNEYSDPRDDAHVERSKINVGECSSEPFEHTSNEVELKLRSSWHANVDVKDRHRSEVTDLLASNVDKVKRQYGEHCCNVSYNNSNDNTSLHEPKEDWDAEMNSSNLCWNDLLRKKAYNGESFSASEIPRNEMTIKNSNVASSTNSMSILPNKFPNSKFAGHKETNRHCLCSKDSNEVNASEENEEKFLVEKSVAKGVTIDRENIHLPEFSMKICRDVMVSGLYDDQLDCKSNCDQKTTISEPDEKEQTNSVSALKDAFKSIELVTKNTAEIKDLPRDDRSNSRDHNKDSTRERKSPSTENLVKTKNNFIDSLEHVPEIRHNQEFGVDETISWDPAMHWEDAIDRDSQFVETMRVSKGMSCKLSSLTFSKFCRENNPNFIVCKRKIELDAFALSELAKNVLSRASGQYERNNVGAECDMLADTHHGLQLAALEIGLFSLKLHNRISPKWLSRTYSSQFSWIATQAIEIGSRGLILLKEKWQGTLTPSEVIDIARRASRLGEPSVKLVAAELALSCLPNADMLNPSEIHSSLMLCKEQGIQMLEQACCSIESVSKNSCIQPEMLFLIARQWHFIHSEVSQGSNARPSNDQSKNPSSKPSNDIKCDENHESMKKHYINENESERSHGCDKLLECSIKDSSQIGLFSASCTILTPEQYVQQQMHKMAQEMLSRNLSKPGRNVKVPDEVTSFSWIYPQYVGQLLHYPMPQHLLTSKNVLKTDELDIPMVIHAKDNETYCSSQQLQKAYVVGMRALEMLASRPPEDSAIVKYAHSPPCADDIRWMCALAASLGPQYLKKFCNIVIDAVSSPYVLHDIALEAARNLAMYNPAQLASHLRSPCVNPIVLKCLTMYNELVRRELTLLSKAGYADFVELLRRARSAFCMAPGGMTKFNDLLEMIRKQYPKKKELWQVIMNGLSRA